jgi:lysozyme
METSTNGLSFISKHEGWSATAYMDANDGWTIGFGHLIQEPAESYLINKTITKYEGLALMRADTSFAASVIRSNVKPPLNQNQFDALVSLVYNIGIDLFKNSTVLKRINSMDTPERISEAWKRFNKDDGKVLAGLVKRRAEEVELYYSDPDLKKKFLSQSEELS